MRRFHSVSAATLIVAQLLASSTAAPAFADTSATVSTKAALDRTRLAERVRARLARLAQEDGFRGVVMIDIGGQTVLAEAVGAADPTSGRPYRVDTQGEIGSISKCFTAAAVLKLKDQGKLKLDDPIGRYLPNVPADKAGITIRQLLTHTAGLPDYVPDAAGQLAPTRDDEAMTREEMERRVLIAPLAFEPGKGWAYSNAGYSLAAAIVERVSGRPIERFLIDEVLAPAGLRHTGFAAVYDEASSDRSREGSSIRDASWGPQGPQWALIGSGGMVSTAAEMIAWRRAFMAGKIVSPASVREATTGGADEGRPGVAERYGLGVGLLDHPVYGRIIWHNGGNPWFTSDLRYFADHDMTIYVHTNSRTSATRSEEHTSELQSH